MPYFLVYENIRRTYEVYLDSYDIGPGDDPQEIAEELALNEGAGIHGDSEITIVRDERDTFVEEN